MYVNDGNDDKRWNIYMRHLIQEWSAENLCFVLEVMQFKKQFVDAQNWEIILAGKKYIKDASSGWIIKLPPNLPQSAIISENKQNYQVQVQQLYIFFVCIPTNSKLSFASRCAQ